MDAAREGARIEADEYPSPATVRPPGREVQPHLIVSPLTAVCEAILAILDARGRATRKELVQAGIPESRATLALRELVADELIVRLERGLYAPVSQAARLGPPPLSLGKVAARQAGQVARADLQVLLHEMMGDLEDLLSLARAHRLLPTGPWMPEADPLDRLVGLARHLIADLVRARRSGGRL